MSVASLLLLACLTSSQWHNVSFFASSAADRSECLFSSYKNGAEAIKLLDVGIGCTCQPIIPCEYADELDRCAAFDNTVSSCLSAAMLATAGLFPHFSALDVQLHRL